MQGDVKLHLDYLYNIIREPVKIFHIKLW